MRETQTRVYGRLHARGMRNVATEALGQCFFIAMVETARLPVTFFQLRQQVCDYMLANEALLRDVFDSRDAFLAHVRKMRKVEAWATHLEVTAAVHLTTRPVHLVTDAVVDEQCDGPTVEPWSHNRKGYPPE